MKEIQLVLTNKLGLHAGRRRRLCKRRRGSSPKLAFPPEEKQRMPKAFLVS